jgi:hypothetical protein
MANKKITALPALGTTPATDDVPSAGNAVIFLLAIL